jgi:hypothetical protein
MCLRFVFLLITRLTGWLRDVACRPDARAQLCGGAPDAVLVLFYDIRHMESNA